MKKLLLFISLVGSVLSLNAQQMKYRLELGLNQSMKHYNENESPDGGASHYTLKGWRVGAMAEYSFKPYLYVSSGLNFTRIGSRLEAGCDPSFERVKYYNKDYSLNAPLNLGLRWHIVKDFSLAIEGGLYASYLLDSKSFYEKGEKSSATAGRKRWGYGWGLAFLVEGWDRVYLRMGTDYGLSNTIDHNSIKLKSAEVYWTLGVRF